jgi:hypothetical protein
MHAAIRALAPDAVEAARRQAGAASRTLVLFAAKEREARRSLPALVAAVRGMPAVQLAIKPHPAETPEVYQAVVSGAPNVSVLPASMALAPLLAAAQAIVTVNSTVAIDALTLGVPSLVIGLPNNLTPFVDAGLMAGARTAEEIHDGLVRVLYDQEFRNRIESRRAMDAGRQSAARSAEAIVRLTGAM